MFKQTHITYVFGCFSTNLKSEHMTQQSWLHHSLLRLFNSTETEMQPNATNQTPLFIGKANTHTHEMRLLIRVCLSDIGVSGLLLESEKGGDFAETFVNCWDVCLAWISLITIW